MSVQINDRVRIGGVIGVVRDTYEDEASSIPQATVDFSDGTVGQFDADDLTPLEESRNDEDEPLLAITLPRLYWKSLRSFMTTQVEALARKKRKRERCEGRFVPKPGSCDVAIRTIQRFAFIVDTINAQLRDDQALSPLVEEFRGRPAIP